MRGSVAMYRNRQDCAADLHLDYVEHTTATPSMEIGRTLANFAGRGGDIPVRL